MARELVTVHPPRMSTLGYDEINLCHIALHLSAKCLRDEMSGPLHPRPSGKQFNTAGEEPSSNLVCHSVICNRKHLTEMGPARVSASPLVFYRTTFEI